MGNDFNGENLNFCDINCSRDYKNEIFNDGFAMTSPVASFPNGQSWVGIYDMAGNVSEWTANGIYSYNPEADWSEQGFVSVETDPNPGYQKVVRGGSWNNTSRFARTAHRAFPAPEEQSEFVGFRCAISP
ncbi:MAG: SUMF1/EgtB/PvdO family nonheme iron enzyme [Chloroflexota bacterium]